MLTALEYIKPKAYADTVYVDNMISLVLVEDLKALRDLTVNQSTQLRLLIEDVLEHKSFETVAVHDEFKAHANNMNRVRYWYKELLAEIAESNLMVKIVSSLYGREMNLVKFGDVADLIRKSNYALA